MKGISKWVETAMRPVPERSHMLKTCPTKAGPPFPLELIDAILTVDGNPEFESDDDTRFISDLEDTESGRDEEDGEGIDDEPANSSGRQSLEGVNGWD